MGISYHAGTALKGHNKRIPLIPHRSRQVTIIYVYLLHYIYEGAFAFALTSILLAGAVVKLSRTTNDYCYYLTHIIIIHNARNQKQCDRMV